MSATHSQPPLPTVDAISGSELRRRFISSGRPVRIKGLAAGWPALTDWDFATLRERCGRNPVTVERSRTGIMETDPLRYLAARYYERQALSDALSAFELGVSNGDYVTNASLRVQLPELEGDVRPLHEEIGFPAAVPGALRRMLCLSPGLWIGPAGIVTLAHYDRHDNLHVQIKGRKRWTLFSPADSDRLYRGFPQLSSPIFSPVDVEQPDTRKFPMFCNAQPLRVELEPGDVLFVPSGWWHHVRTVETSISLNYWWRSLRSARVATAVALRQMWMGAQATLGLRRGVGKIEGMPAE